MGGTFWKYKRISGQEGPLNKNHSSWKGDKYNVKVEWEKNGEVSYEPLQTIAVDDPVTCAIYAREHGLLDIDGWKRFGSLSKKAKKMLRMVNQSKLRSYRTCKKYMYGFEIPRGYEDAIRLNKVLGQLLGRSSWGGVQEDPSSSCVCVQAPDSVLFGLLGSDNISICG
jgi:hypothetical protein